MKYKFRFLGLKLKITVVRMYIYIYIVLDNVGGRKLDHWVPCSSARRHTVAISDVRVSYLTIHGVWRKLLGQFDFLYVSSSPADCDDDGRGDEIDSLRLFLWIGLSDFCSTSDLRTWLLNWNLSSLRYNLIAFFPPPALHLSSFALETHQFGVCSTNFFLP